MGASKSRRGTAREVERRPRAKLDVIECAAYLGESAGADTADRFLDAVENTLAELAAMPRIGSPRTRPRKTLAGLRQWPVKGFSDYLVFYRPTLGGVEIVRLLHGARDREAILGLE